MKFTQKVANWWNNLKGQAAVAVAERRLKEIDIKAPLLQMMDDRDQRARRSVESFLDTIESNVRANAKELAPAALMLHSITVDVKFISDKIRRFTRDHHADLEIAKRIFKAAVANGKEAYNKEI